MEQTRYCCFLTSTKIIAIIVFLYLLGNIIIDFLFIKDYPDAYQWICSLLILIYFSMMGIIITKVFYFNTNENFLEDSALYYGTALLILIGFLAMINAIVAKELDLPISLFWSLLYKAVPLFTILYYDLILIFSNCCCKKREPLISQENSRVVSVTENQPSFLSFNYNETENNQTINNSYQNDVFLDARYP